MLCVVTERKLCPEPLPDRLEKLLAAGIPYVMLREKDLPADDLLRVSQAAAEIAARHNARLIINSGPAEAVGAWALHLPFDRLIKSGFKRPARARLGVSIHSLGEALAAEEAGADYVLAGHIFETDCKKGLPGRGLGFLAELRRGLKIPVWAVGGLTPDNIGPVLAAGASVACVRSALMECPDPAAALKEYLARARAGR